MDIIIVAQPPLEPLPTYTGICCREWPLAMGFPVGRCGLCGTRPVYLRTDPYPFNPRSTT